MDRKNSDTEIQTRHVSRCVAINASCAMCFIISLVFTRARSFDKWISTKKEDLYAVCLSFRWSSHGAKNNFRLGRSC